MMRKNSTKYSLLIILLTVLLAGLLSCSKDKDEPTIDNTVRFLPGAYPDSTITDGPFIFDNGSRYSVKWIEKNSAVKEIMIAGNDDGSFETRFGFSLILLKIFWMSL